MKKKITFYSTNPPEKGIFYPIAKIAKKKGFIVSFSENLKKRSNIGFYCFSEPEMKSTNVKINSKVSVIFLGGIDQGRSYWPNIWAKQPWNNFDLGFLPGKDWSNRWQLSSWFFKSRTKGGVFESGWPKTDILKNKKLIKKKNKIIRKKYSIPNKGKNILYAPGFECNEKQTDVAKSVKNLNYHLIVKHWISNKKENQDLWKRVEIANKKTNNLLKSNLSIVKPYENFIEILPSADLIITDESSVAYEALLLDIPTLSVSDWIMQRHEKAIPRYVNPAKICITTKKKDLTEKIRHILNNKSFYQKKIKKKKKQHFSNVGVSAKIIIEILNKYLKGKNLTKSKYYLKPMYEISTIKCYIFKLFNGLKKIKNFLIWIILKKT